MNLEQVADKAMKYLDSVGVAAEYNIRYMHLRVTTDNHAFTCAYDDNPDSFIRDISYTHPQKSPNKGL